MITTEIPYPYGDPLRPQYAILINRKYSSIQVVQFTNIYSFIDEIVENHQDNEITIYRTQLYPPNPEELEMIYQAAFS